MHKLLLNFIAFIILAGAQNVFAGCAPNIDSDIQKILDEYRLKYRIPGLQVSVSCPGEQSLHEFVSGTVTIGSSESINSQHLFQIGSETKSLIATLILQLEAEHVLSIHDPIGTYLDNIPETWQQIRIEQLLNHTSGLYNYTDVLREMLQHNKNLDVNKQWSSEELVNLVKEKPFYFKPGMGWHYSNTGYVLAGMIIEGISGKSLEEEIKTRIIEPLHLSNTYYLPYLYNKQIMEQMAHGYSASGIFSEEPRDITEMNHSWTNAAGAVVSTSEDVIHWFKNLLSGSLFPKEQMNELMTFVEGTFPNTERPIDYGLGIIHDVQTFGEEALWHSGGTLGYNSIMVWLKCHDIMISMNMNQHTGNQELYLITQNLVSYFYKTDSSRCAHIEK